MAFTYFFGLFKYILIHQVLISGTRCCGVFRLQKLSYVEPFFSGALAAFSVVPFGCTSWLNSVVIAQAGEVTVSHRLVKWLFLLDMLKTGLLHRW